MARASFLLVLEPGVAELAESFRCRVCGEEHLPLPLSFSVKYPLAVKAVSPEDVERRVVMTADQCVLDGERFFLRGRVVIAVHGIPEVFVWGVWAEVSPKNFLRTQQLWTVAGREREPAYPGWLDTELPLYGTTLNLEVRVVTQPVGRRPHFEVVAGEHALGREQREGMSRERAEEIASRFLHAG